MNSSVFQNISRSSFFLGLIIFSSSFSFASEISDTFSEKREYTQSVSSSCSPQFVEVTPEKYSEIGDVETLSFTLKNNANPDSMSVRINNQELDFSLREEFSDRFSRKGDNQKIFTGTIDVSNAKKGRQIVSLYAESNDAIHCSYREYIYVLYKNNTLELVGGNLRNSEKQDVLKEVDPLQELFFGNFELENFIENFIENSVPKILFPVENANIFTVDSSVPKQKISGLAPKETKKIWVDFSDEHGNTEHYFLRKFSEGDKKWDYFASKKYNNLSTGLNTYRVYAEFENGKFSDAETIILFHPAPDFTPEFSDTKNHWAEKSIHFLKSKGIVHGRIGGKFFPNSSITKAESLKISTLAFNVKKHLFKKDDYIDVKASDWFADYASTAEKEGVIFEPRKNISPEKTISENQAEEIIINSSFQKLNFKSSSSEVTRAEFSEEVVKLMK